MINPRSGYNQPAPLFHLEERGRRPRMNRPATTKLRIGDWCVDPASGQISRDGTSTRLEARTLRLLLCLAEHRGEVISIDDLLSQAWSGVIVTPDSVYQAVTSLRRILGDDPKQPAYIATVPRLGYRMVATVSPWNEDSADEKDSRFSHSAHSAPRSSAKTFRWIVSIVLCLAAVAVLVLFLRGKSANGKPSATPAAADSQPSVAVLPFIDLTEGMKQEEFADGVTEELIDKLSKIPGLHVPAPTASFYFKYKQIPVADIARSLGVAYILDGSTRQSGAAIRIAARLVRAENGYVIWSETYDRPFIDRVKVQDDVAGAVMKGILPALNPKVAPR